MLQFEDTDFIHCKFFLFLAWRHLTEYEHYLWNVDIPYFMNIIYEYLFENKVPNTILCIDFYVILQN